MSETLKTIGIFADVGNLYFCVNKKFPGRKMNYSLLRERAIGEHTLYRAIAYGFQVKDEASKFISCLKTIGFDTKYRNLEQKKIDGSDILRTVRSSWNVQIALDVIAIIDKLNIVVLCTSDPDIEPLVSFIKSRGVICKVMSAGINKRLRQAADSCIELDETFLEPIHEPKGDA